MDYVNQDCEECLKIKLDKKRAKLKNEGCSEEYISAFIEGYAIGFREGWAEAATEIAQRMIKKGITVADISYYTGLTIAEIKKL